jgi:hypothetical protein
LLLSRYFKRARLDDHGRRALILGSGIANAGQTIDDVGAMACVNDKWDEKEPEKGHKLVDFAGRCINVPNDPRRTEKRGGLRRKLRVHA